MRLLAINNGGGGARNSISTKDRDCLQISGAPVLLGPNVAQAVAVTFHELATLSRADGKVILTWQHEPGGELGIRWSETGGPPVRPPTREGSGTRVIGRMIGDLQGKADFDWRPEGLICEIQVRL
jgi:two-component sensor histidine kinase